MIKSDLTSVFGSKTIAAFHRQFDFGIEALDDTAGKLTFCLEVVEEKRTVRAQGAGDFFEWFETAASDFHAPGIQELCRPSWGKVGPEVLEGFDQKEGSQGAQARALDLAHPAALGRGPVGAFFEEGPAHFLEQGIETGLDAGAGFFTPDVIDGFVELLDDVKAVQDMQGLGQEVSCTVEVGLPHVGAKEADALAEVFTHDLEEEIDGGLGAVVADPEEAFGALIDLVNQRPELVFFTDMNFIDPQGTHSGEIPVLDAKLHDPLDGRINVGPGTAKTAGDLGPGKQSSPPGQKEAKDIAVLVLTACPGHLLDGGTTVWTVDAPWGIGQKDGQPPERNKVPSTLGLSVISGGRFSTPGADAASALPCGDLDSENRLAGGLVRFECCTAIDKSLDRVKGSQYGFDRYARHVTGWFTGALPGSASLTFCLGFDSNVPPSPLERPCGEQRGFGGSATIKPVRFTHRFFYRAAFSCCPGMKMLIASPEADMTSCIYDQTAS